MRTVVMMALTGVLLLDHPTQAEEQIRTLAISGNWIAGEHSPSMTDLPDVCIAADIVDGIAIRADADVTELRVTDHSWSLPADVTGSIQVDVGYFHRSFNIASNTDQVISVVLSPDTVLELFAGMDSAGGMTLTVGNARPRLISLVGSTKATNAFRTCAHIRSTAPGAGANPFTSSR